MTSAAFHFVKINDLMDATQLAASIRVPVKGWFIFGGNVLATSQKLVNVSSIWEAGPTVQKTGTFSQCAVQVQN